MVIGKREDCKEPDRVCPTLFNDCSRKLEVVWPMLGIDTVADGLGLAMLGRAERGEVASPF